MVLPAGRAPVPDLCAECLAKRLAWWKSFKPAQLPEHELHVLARASLKKEIGLALTLEESDALARERSG